MEAVKMTPLHMPEREVLISNPNVNRPGLPLTGFYEHFDATRIQVIGKSEYNYLNELSRTIRHKRLHEFMASEPVAVVYTTDLQPGETMLKLAREYDVPLLCSPQNTSAFMVSIYSRLALFLAPCITRHGVLVEVYGEGVLIFGDSGIGKSETAIELVKRGHRLIADDAVEIKKVSAITLVGSAPALIKHYIELRGIGIADVRRIFGMGSVKESEKIDLIINFENWVQGKLYDRFGLDSEYTEILGIKIPSITVPVKPGRNLAVIIEIAAMNNRQKKMGYNTAAEFEKRLLEQSQENE